MYSYKAPRKKRLLSKDSLLWIIFVSIVFFALVLFGSYLYYKASSYHDKLSRLESSNKALSTSVINYEKEMKILKMQSVLSQEVKSSNTLLKNSIKNLFDLVPDQITLTKVVMEKYRLHLEGTTFTKDSYRLLLEPPLKSIFNSTKATFTFNGAIGKYEFVSINEMNEEAKEGIDGKK